MFKKCKKVYSKGGCLFIDREHVILSKDKTLNKVLLVGLCLAYMKKYDLKEKDLINDIKETIKEYNEFMKKGE